MDNQQFVTELSKLRPGSTFLTLRGYRNEASEIADYSIAFHFSYENALKKSIQTLAEMDLTGDLEKQARSELLNSFAMSLARGAASPELEERDPTYLHFKNDDGEYVKGVKMHRETFTLYLYGLGLIVASFFCYRALGSDLLPAMDEGGFILDYLMPAGSSLDDTNAVLLGVEKILDATPEVESTSRRTGLQLGLAAVTEANTGDFSVRLKRDRTRTIEQVISEVRDKVNKKYPQLDVEFIQVLQDMIGDLTSSPEPIEIKLFSPDPALLKAVGAEGRRQDQKASKASRT